MMPVRDDGVSSGASAVLGGGSLNACPCFGPRPLSARQSPTRQRIVAVQLRVAHSQLVRGVGGPYDCARGSIFRALKNCMSASANMWAPQTFLCRCDSIGTMSNLTRAQPADGKPAVSGAILRGAMGGDAGKGWLSQRRMLNAKNVSSFADDGAGRHIGCRNGPIRRAGCRAQARRTSLPGAARCATAPTARARALSIRAWPRSIRIICRNSSGTFAMDGA